jgi:hypothetical protein
MNAALHAAPIRPPRAASFIARWIASATVAGP